MSCLWKFCIWITALGRNHLTPLVHCFAVAEVLTWVNAVDSGLTQHFSGKLHSEFNDVGWTATG